MTTPTSANEQFQIAVGAHQSGDLETAELAYRATLRIDPAHSASSNNLGLILVMTDRFDAAISSFEQALRSDPRSADASINLAQALHQSARYQQALQQWQHASSLSPQRMEPALAGALLAIQIGELGRAMDLLEAAALGEPVRDDSRSTLIKTVAQLGATQLNASALGDALRMASLLTHIDPNGDTGPRMLERSLRNAQLREFDASIKDNVLTCYRSDAVDHRQLGRISAQLLLAQYPVLRTDPAQPLAPSSLRAVMAAQQLHRDPLLLAFLKRSINTDPMLERALRRLRGELLSAHLNEQPLCGSWLEFSAALAMQCFANEYVYSESRLETEQVQTLTAQVNRDPGNWPALAVLAAYRATYQLDVATRINKLCAQAPAWMMPLLQRTLLEPATERRLRATISESTFTNSTSRTVQSQYEESPYPRWQNLELQVPLTVGELLRGQITNFAPPAILEQPVDILVAGCGTGEHALRVAARHPQCQVYAIDLSRASLAYAARKARELDINNIQFRHRDILELRDDKERYALIECVGVIHHMRDPNAGLAALCAQLAPNGIIKLGLYSRAARAQVNAARVRIRELELSANAEDMRSLRVRILDGHEPQMRSLCESQDLYTLSMVRDLLFHVQEHQFDTQQLRALLAANDLHVIGFHVSASTRRRYQQRFADDPALANLANWGEFERDSPNTFAGMYQFWCRRQ